MAIGNRGMTLGQLDTLFRLGMTGSLTDAQLLDRFRSRRDDVAELAFRALVERHGAMVFRVCRAVLRDVHEAEEAFQATFLVLARRAGSLWVRDTLGPWLHQVAHRTSVCARATMARRRRHELRVAELADRAEDGAELDDVGDVVHQELGRLPARYREAVVLCLLEGLTPEQAARQLDCPVGTVHSRLARGREQLRSRLARRGLSVPVAALARGAPAPADSAVQSVIRAGMGAASAEAVSAHVVALSGVISRSMLMAKIRVTAALLMLGGGLVIGAGVVASQEPEARPPADAVPPADRPEASRQESPEKSIAKDSLGDPLPPGARLRLGTLRFRPASGVQELALSPDDKTIITAGGPIAWDAATGKELWRASPENASSVPVAAYGVRALAFSSDSSRFYTPLGPDGVGAWETASGRFETLKLDPRKSAVGVVGGQARSIDVTSDGATLALGNPAGVAVYDRSGSVLYEIVNAPKKPVDSSHDDRLAFYEHYSFGRFSPDGTILAIVLSEKPDELRLYESRTGRELRRVALAGRLVRLAFSPDSKRLAATERDSAVRLYDVATGERIWSHIIKLTNIYENYASAIAFHPDGKALAVCATDHRIYVLDPSTGEEQASLAGTHWYPWCLAFTSKGERLYSSGWDATIRGWDVAGRKQLSLTPTGHVTGVIAISPDGKALAYEDDQGPIHLADAGSGQERGTLSLPGANYDQLVFSPDGRQLAGGGAVGDQVHVAVWDMPDGKLRHRWDWPKGRDPHSVAESLHFSPDGSRLATAVFRQNAAYLFDLKQGRQIARLSQNSVRGVSFSPDGKTLVTGGWDSKLRFWETETGNARGEFKVGDHAKGNDLRIEHVVHSQEGGWIATAHLDGNVLIWRADGMRLHAQFNDGNFNDGALSFSPDGLWLATGTRSNRVTILDPSTARSVWDLGLHQNNLLSVGFSRDARTLVSGSGDGICYVWDLRSPDPRPDDTPSRLVDTLFGDDTPAAFQAMAALADHPDTAVALLSERLRPLTSVVDLDRADEGISPDEAQRRRRLRMLHINKDPKLASVIAVRRALSLLAQFGTPEALAPIKSLVERDPKGDLGRLATATLTRIGASRTP